MRGIPIDIFLIEKAIVLVENLPQGIKITERVIVPLVDIVTGGQNTKGCEKYKDFFHSPKLRKILLYLADWENNFSLSEKRIIYPDYFPEAIVPAGGVVSAVCDIAAVSAWRALRKA